MWAILQRFTDEEMLLLDWTVAWTRKESIAKCMKALPYADDIWTMSDWRMEKRKHNLIAKKISLAPVE